MIVNERMLIKKAKFPREAIILSIVLSNLFHVLVFLPIFFIITFLMGQLNGCWFLLTPILLVFLTLLVSGLSLLFSSLNVKYRDVNFAVSALVPLWFYATPIMYDLSLLPKQLANYLYLNPMTSIVEIFRFLILGTPMYSTKWAIISLISVVIVLIYGIHFFKKEEPFFDDWV
jgi:ABC-type polysaccharide/polyol phosphate export permease